MTYQPLHHKYRPQTLGELVGQETIATMLSNALEQQRIAPAYLFTGARGTGKTSSARILAKSLNCLEFEAPTSVPCNKCSACTSITKGTSLDVVEIDAASNTGVDNMRNLIGQSQFQPLQCRYKVYVVDEAHMLSTPAFNALLKTLEEPPDRVVFVLATTDPQRVMPTIISRCQKYDFQRIPTKAIAKHLTTIAQAEAIEISGEALTLIAQIAQGGLRDAETLLDQLSLLGDKITPQHVWQISGGLSEPDLLELLTAMLQPGTNPMNALHRLCDQGQAPATIVEGLLRFVTDLQQLCTTNSETRLHANLPTTVAQLKVLAVNVSVTQLQLFSMQCTGAITLIKQSSQPVVWLERCVLDLITTDGGTQTTDVTAPLDLDDLWKEVVQEVPPSLHRLLLQIRLVRLEKCVATLGAPNPVTSATVKNYAAIIRNGFLALGYTIEVQVQTSV